MDDHSVGGEPSDVASLMSGACADGILVYDSTPWYMSTITVCCHQVSDAVHINRNERVM